MFIIAQEVVKIELWKDETPTPFFEITLTNRIDSGRNSCIRIDYLRTHIFHHPYDDTAAGKSCLVDSACYHQTIRHARCCEQTKNGERKRLSTTPYS